MDHTYVRQPALRIDGTLQDHNAARHRIHWSVGRTRNFELL